jgi:uncharacterized protein YprB with RNaseH-like and TPR domain
MGLDSKFNIYLNSLKSESTQKKNTNNQPLIGYIRQTPHGETWVVDWIYHLGQMHGRYPIQKTGRIHQIIDIKLTDFNPALATVVDTETTGLAGGTGTYAFIIGIGFWRGDQFIVRQYLMRDFNEEPAQLFAFAEDYTGSLITFNGKCFDMPLLTSRFKLHKFELPFAESDHLDMLFPSRRIWKRHLDSFKLSILERDILGFARVDDIPSHLIPSLFFDYLQTRDETILHPILHHNRNDILSLYQLTGIADELINRVCDLGGNDDELIVSLAEIYFNQRQYGKSIELLDKINRQFADKRTFNRASQVKAIALKKLNHWDEAIEAYLAAHELDRQVETLIESAKLYEHKKKQPQKALDLVHRAESILEFAELRGDINAGLLAELAHRKRRLLNRLHRSN